MQASEDGRSISEPRKLPWWTWLVPALVCQIGTQLSVNFQFAPGVAILYLPIPLGLAMAFWWGPRVLPGIFLNAMLSAGLWDLPRWWLWPVYALPETVAVLVAWFLFTKLADGKYWLPDLRSTVLYICAAIVPAATIDGFQVAGQLVLLGDLAPGDFFGAAIGEWTAMFLASFAVTVPLLVLGSPALSRRGLTRRVVPANPVPFADVGKSPLNAVEISTAFGLTLLFSFFLSVDRFWFLYAIIALWAALRYGLGMAAISNLWIVFLTLILPAVSSGLYGASWSPDSETAYVYVGLGVLCVTSLITGSTISTRTATEKTLAENRRFLEAVINTTPDLIYIYDLETSENVFANQEVLDFLGYSRDQVREAGGAILANTIHPDDMPLVLEHHQWLRNAEDASPREVEYRMRDSQGRWRWIRSRDSAFLRAESGLVRQIAGHAEDITEQKSSAESLRRALREKETLLRELYHRTKNNMNLISAMLDLQAAELDDPRLQAAFEETKNRIYSMALVHQKLYQNQDLSRVNLREYINELIALLIPSYNISLDKISLDLQLEEISVVIDTAIPVGLMLNELITNVFKYAFPGAASGSLGVVLRRLQDHEILLEVADTGVGFSESFNPRTDGHLGLQTILIIAEDQLQGRVEFETGSGLRCKIRFRDDVYKTRF